MLLACMVGLIAMFVVIGYVETRRDQHRESVRLAAHQIVTQELRRVSDWDGLSKSERDAAQGALLRVLGRIDEIDL